MGQNGHFAHDRSRLGLLKPLIPEVGDLGAANAGHVAVSQWVGNELVDLALLLRGSSFVRGDLALIPFQAFLEGGLLRLAPWLEDPAIHLALDHARPDFGIPEGSIDVGLAGAGDVEGFGGGGQAFAADFDPDGDDVAVFVGATLKGCHGTPQGCRMSLKCPRKWAFSK